MLIDQIVRETGFSRERVLEIIHRAPHAYCVYGIPKRTGKGIRVIAHPARQLKALQRWIADRVLVDLPVHESVFSYRPGRGIRVHASVHLDNNYLLRIDLKDYFPSIKQADVIALLRVRKNSISMELKDEDIDLIARLVCKGNAITIGSPSSPAISNAVLYDFDIEATEIALRHEAVYTRYADDIYFSTNTPDVLSKILDEVRQAFQNLAFPRVVINEDKIVFTSRKRKRVVTGLVLTSDSKISLGRSKKRHIRGLLHRFDENQLGEKEISYLKGYLAYCNDAEPDFMISIRKKYGEPLLERLFKTPTVLRKEMPSKMKLKGL